MSLRRPLAIALLVLAVCWCVALGTLGWFVVGFGLLTDCTSNYSCTSTGCAPCQGATGWVNVGGVGQWVLAIGAVTALVRGIRARRETRMLTSGFVVLVLSLSVIAVTTWRASESYCRPGTPGYAQSYCPTSS